MKPNKSLQPPWVEKAPDSNSFRSLFKWGEPTGFKHPNQGMVALLKEVFQLDQTDFTQPQNTGFEKFHLEIPTQLPLEHQRAFEEIVGSENIQTDTFTRTRVAYGHGMIDALRLRNHIVENIPDLVIAPRSDDDIKHILTYCDQNHIPVNIFGAGSTVTRGTEAKNGGVSLDMSKHMNKVLAFNETNQTITVQPGMTGPQL